MGVGGGTLVEVVVCEAADVLVSTTVLEGAVVGELVVFDETVVVLKGAVVGELVLVELDKAEEPGESEVLVGDAVLDPSLLDIELLLICETVEK